MVGRVAPPPVVLFLAYCPVVGDVNYNVIGAAYINGFFYANIVAGVALGVDVLKANVMGTMSVSESQLWVSLDDGFDVASLPTVTDGFATACVTPSIALISGCSTGNVLQRVVDDVLDFLCCCFHVSVPLFPVAAGV